MGLNTTYNHIPRYFVSFDHRLWTWRRVRANCPHISIIASVCKERKKSLKYNNNFHSVCLVSKDGKSVQQKEKQLACVSSTINPKNASKSSPKAVSSTFLISTKGKCCVAIDKESKKSKIR